MIISLDTGSTVTKLASKPVFNFKGSTVGLSVITEGSNDDVVVSGGTSGSLKIGCFVDALQDTATITPEIELKLPKELQHIKTINGVGPTDAGEFFIDGSECDSWDVLPDNGNGISIVDLCPSCTTCENIYRLKYEVENLKMWLNTLKDVNIFLDSEVGKRAEMLSEHRITSLAEANLCNAGLQPDDEYRQIRGLQLLQQYITTVHMWNYIVSRNNASTIIETAPEDTTGFVVQTKRALTSCHCNQTLRCTIKVRPLWAFTDDGNYITIPYDISVYVPDGSNKVRCEPLVKKDQELAIDVSQCVITTVSPEDPADYPYANKLADTTEMPVKVAGTYVVSVKFLPFVYYKAWRDSVVNGHTVHVPISIRGGTTTEVKGQTASDGTVVYDFSISGHTTYVKPSEEPEELQGEPTEADYLVAKTVPTCSVPFQLIWSIEITWQVREQTSGGWVDKEPDVETYQYAANGIRSYYGDILDNTVIPPPPEPEDEEQEGGV